MNNKPKAPDQNRGFYFRVQLTYERTLPPIPLFEVLFRAKR